MSEQVAAHSDPPSTLDLVGWLLGITRPVHRPLAVSAACRIANLSLDIALFATAAGGVVHLAGGGAGGPGLWIALVVLAVAKATFAYLEQFTGHYVAFKALELLRTQVFAALWPKAPAVVARSRSGDLLASLTRDVDRIEVVYAHTFAPVVAAWVVGPAAVAVAVTMVGWQPVGPAALCLALSLTLVPALGFRRSMAATADTLAARRDLAHHVTDSVHGRAEVLGYGLVDQRLAEMDAKGAAVAASAVIPREVLGLRRGANTALGLVAVTSVAWLGRSDLSAVALAALLAGTMRVFEGPRGVEDAVGYLDHSLAAARRLWSISHAPEPVVDGPRVLAPDGAPTVEFRDVSYTYPDRDVGTDLEAASVPSSGGPPDQPPAALTGVSLSVPAGSHVAIVGRSGSGKSTLVQLLSRYDDPDHGRIEIDGVATDVCTLDSLRSTVVAVTQRNQLLDDTLAMNLRLGAPEATEAELWEVLAVVGLDDEVRAMPHGLATVVGPGGSALSGGQVQRACLARALLVEPRVLVLDEFTANLNVELDHQIRDALRRWPHEMTVIEVTHRLSALASVDRVAVMDAGRLVGVGSPGEMAGLIDRYFELV